MRVQVQAGGAPPLPLRVEAELFRIAQEALTNVRRHARATEATLTLRAGGGAVRLTIRDDGRGFDPRAVGAGHYGILGMRERAKLLGGGLRIASRPGGGTTIRVTVPLPEERER